MKIRIIKIGKPAFSEYTDLVREFQKRLQPIFPLEVQEIKAINGVEKNSDVLVAMLKKAKDSGKSIARIITLDENGQTLDTNQFHRNLAQWQAEGHISELIFVIGGPFGLSKDLKAAADESWRLSSLVMPSDLAWLVLVEQIYRASAMIRGIDYHH